VVRGDDLEPKIAELLADAQYEGHPLREALAALLDRHQEQLTQIERITSISDGYQVVLRERNQSLTERYRKQIRQLQKIVRISDHYQKMLRDLNDALKVASTQDPLTGLANRRLMIDRLNAEAALVERRGLPFSLALADVDYFKDINDNFGHDVGDEVIVKVAQALRSCSRAYDVVARWGGEEFLILFPETSVSKASEIAERLRQGIEDLRHIASDQETRLTISIGVAEHGTGDQLSKTIKRADMAMYDAKHQGRNRVVQAP
jgi:diguanylate cyclase (GGDEF)-like protein